jgi:mono/diheme cytochrome c family protein
MRGSQSRSGRAAARLVFALAALGLLAGVPAGAARAQAHQPPKIEKDDYVWEHAFNPFSDDPEAIVQGQRLYRSTCYICHLDGGGRGPDLRKSRLRDQDFLRVVINGRKGTQMPAWRGKLSEEEMWKIYSFLQAPRN